MAWATAFFGSVCAICVAVIFCVISGKKKLDKWAEDNNVKQGNKTE